MYNSVTIDVDQLLADRAAERAAEEAAEPEPVSEPEPPRPAKPKVSRKRKQEDLGTHEQPKPKKIRLKASRPQQEVSSTPSTSSSSPKHPLKVTLKLPPKPKDEPETFPCCLCVSQSRDDLLRVQDPPLWRKDASNRDIWMAHEECANVIPETWVDEVELPEVDEQGVSLKEKVVYGVDAIVKDRWNLVIILSYFHCGTSRKWFNT